MAIRAHNGHEIKYTFVIANLLCQSREGVPFALDLEAMHQSIEEREVRPNGATCNSKLFHENALWVATVSFPQQSFQNGPDIGVTH
jgi:hypothetical protein